MMVNSRVKTAAETVSEMISTAEKAGDNEGELLTLTMTSHEVRDLSGRKRTSARLEEDVGKELKRRGRGSREGNNFIIFSGTGIRSISYADAKEIENDLS